MVFQEPELLSVHHAMRRSRRPDQRVDAVGSVSPSVINIQLKIDHR
jgi:hypothetical protein